MANSWVLIKVEKLKHNKRGLRKGERIGTRIWGGRAITADVQLGLVRQECKEKTFLLLASEEKGGNKTQSRGF